MALNIQVERYADVIGEIKPLLEAHWREIASFQDAIPLDPNFDAYERMEAAGTLVILAARRDGALVGYSIFFLLPHVHYQTSLFAMNDILYLAPDERANGTGVRLIKQSERVMREHGARLISWHIKPTLDFSPLLERIGYERKEIVMAKLLEA